MISRRSTAKRKPSSTLRKPARNRTAKLGVKPAKHGRKLSSGMRLKSNTPEVTNPDPPRP